VIQSSVLLSCTTRYAKTPELRALKGGKYYKFESLLHRQIRCKQNPWFRKKPGVLCILASGFWSQRLLRLPFARALQSRFYPVC